MTLAFLCWLHASAAVVLAGFSKAAGETDEIATESEILLGLAMFAWFAAGALFIAVAARAGRPAVVFWSIQAALLTAGFLMTAGAGGIRVAPRVLLVGIAAQVAGFLAAQSVRSPSVEPH